MVRIVHPGSGCWLSPISDPGVKKAPIPGSGTATLHYSEVLFRGSRLGSGAKPCHGHRGSCTNCIGTICTSTNCIGTNCIGIKLIGTNCIGNILYREQIVSGTNCIGNKLYWVQFVSGKLYRLSFIFLPFHFLIFSKSKINCSIVSGVICDDF